MTGSSLDKEGRTCRTNGTIVALMAVSFQSSNFSAGGGFAPFGSTGSSRRSRLGAIFTEGGFEQCIQIAPFIVGAG